MTHTHLKWIWYVACFFCLQSCQQGDSPTSPAADDAKPATAPTVAVQSTLTGKVVGTTSGRAIAGAVVKLGKQTAVTDAQGVFVLRNVSGDDALIEVSGDDIYPRVAALPDITGGSVEIDAIERQSGFSLAFYRELARGNHPTEQNMYPLQRWTTQPTFYIDTNAAATLDKAISPETIEMAESVIDKMLPILTGNLYSSPAIQARSFSDYDFSQIPEHSIVISFDDHLLNKGALGVTFTEPNFQTLPTGSLSKAWIFVLHAESLYRSSSISQIEILAHELGHSFGFRHTSLLPSVMMKIGAYGGTYSKHDQLHMSIVYHRPFGNTDIDADPQPNQQAKLRLPCMQAFVDRLPVTPPSEMTQAAALLPDRTAAFFALPMTEQVKE